MAAVFCPITTCTLRIEITRNNRLLIRRPSPPISLKFERVVTILDATRSRNTATRSLRHAILHNIEHHLEPIVHLISREMIL